MININQAFILITRFQVNIYITDQLGIAAAFMVSIYWELLWKEEISMIMGKKSALYMFSVLFSIEISVIKENQQFILLPVVLF